MHSIGKTVTELHAILKLHEQTVPPKEVAPALHAIRAGRIQKNQKKKSHKAAKGNQGKGKAKMGYAPVQAPPFYPKPKNPPTSKKDNPAKDAICHQCGEVGHWRINWLIYLSELMKKKKLSQGASTSGIFTIELYSFPSTSWVYDTGCGTHICITTQGLRGSRKLKPGALSLYVGDGHRAAVEAIGDYHLCLPSGLVLILHNCHYAPSITRGIILVSRLYKDGFVNHFENDNSISVFKNNMIYFNAIPRDDIYEIVMSSSNTNESSMYVVTNKRAKLNLDSALLWHCHLGHINKKRIEKLQHDRLLDSTDIKSFEKCVACMSGYPKETMRYSFYYPPENKVFVARNAEFLENSLINHEAKIDKPQSDINPIRRSTRTRRPIDRLCLYVNAEEHELGDLSEPANYKSTLLDPESDKWLNAMKVEMQSMKHNEVWELVDLPPNGKTVGHKWLFKKKTYMDGAVHTYNARLVAKGFTQTSGIDYEETFSPVADIRAIKILIAIAAFYDYEIWQMDVKTAFLNGYLNDEVYMEQPEGFVSQKFPNRVCKLKRSIYGLKQASRQWNKLFDDEIKKFGFSQNRDEPCVYVKASGSYVTFLILYVDDILIMENNIPMLQDVKSYLERCFAMKDLGEATYILGIKIYRDRLKPLIDLCQSAYIEKILKRYYMENSKRGTIPMQEKLKFSKSQAVGSIMYDVRCIRPDVAFAQNITSRFQQNPGDAHWTAVKNILKYLRNTKDMFLVYGGVVDWKSTKQSTFATSSTNAEYISTFDASKEAIWIRKFIYGLGVVPTIEEPINMYCDNTRVIVIAKDHRVTKGSRHFRAKVHYLRETIEMGDVRIEKVDIDDSLADPFTKDLAFPKHSELTEKIGMIPASSLM
ncbi:retrotransposon protein, putative, ty1-copia subclass [Tanacetum coccineum]